MRTLKNKSPTNVHVMHILDTCYKIIVCSVNTYGDDGYCAALQHSAFWQGNTSFGFSLSLYILWTLGLSNNWDAMDFHC